MDSCDSSGAAVSAKLEGVGYPCVNINYNDSCHNKNKGISLHPA